MECPIRLKGSDVKEIDAALSTASKRGTGKAGYPEFTSVVDDFVIVTEDKADLDKHMKLTETGVVDTDTKAVTDYAVNGAYYYASILRKTVHLRKCSHSAFPVMRSITKSHLYMWMIGKAIRYCLI